MKKVLFSFAAVTIAAMMVSCGGNSTSSGEDTDSVIIEVDEPELSGQTLEAEDFTLVIPEGWMIEDLASTFLKIKKDMPDNLPKQLLFLPYPKSVYSAEEKLNEKLAFNVEQEMPPVTLAGKTWYVLYKAPVGDNKSYYYYYVDMPKGGYMNVQALNGYEGTNDPEIKAIMKSVKFK